MGVLKDILSLFNFIKNLFQTYSFEILLIVCILFLVIYGIYRKIKKEKGTWSTSYFYDYLPKELKAEENNYNSSNNRHSFESKGESECRRVLEKIFNVPFPKTRPRFLNNPVTGGNFNLELDCYNDDLKIAVEYDGRQHRLYTPYFHKNKEAFYNQKYRDELKRRMCKDNGVYLIQVPDTVKLENIENFIKDKLRPYLEIMTKMN
jgi:hypothetical protein